LSTIWIERRQSYLQILLLHQQFFLLIFLHLKSTDTLALNTASWRINWGKKRGKKREKQEDVLEKIRRCIFHFWITLISLPSPSANTPSPSWISESPKLLTFMKWTSLYSLSVEWQAIIEIFWGKSRRGKITNNNGLLFTPWFFNVEAISWFLNWVSSTLKKIRHCNSRIGEKVVEVESQTTVAYSHFMIL